MSLNDFDQSGVHETVSCLFQDGKYGIGDGNLFTSLSELVNFYRRNNMKDKSGIEVTLRQVRETYC